MVSVSNLRKINEENRVKILCDIDYEDPEDLAIGEKQLWFSVEKKYESMLADDVYDAFFLIPLYLAMYLHTDLCINGYMSKTLYKNMVNYGQSILCGFSDALKPVHVSVEGFRSAPEKGSVIGASISGGVDSLTTIYDRYVCETIPDDRINSLFFFNCGTHGDYGDPKTVELFEQRYAMNKNTADEIGLPMVKVDSNLHAFSHKLGAQKSGCLALISCVIALQRAIRKYYFSSALGYIEQLQFGFKQYHDYDFSGFAASQLFPLIKTENTEIIDDGAQYKRSEKTERIADWDIAQKHLNVCVNPAKTASNCSTCSKCLRTLIALDAIGKAELFKTVFDLDLYKTRKKDYLYECMMKYGKTAYETDNVDCARRHGMPLPSAKEVEGYRRRQQKPKRPSISIRIKNLIIKLLGPKKTQYIKKILHRK